MLRLMLAMLLLAPALAGQSYTVAPIANDFEPRANMINAFGSGAQALHFGGFANPSTGQPDNDEGVGTAGLLFQFPFYGANYNQVYVSTNGLVSFSPMTSAYATPASAVPDAAGPNNFIAALWKNLGAQPLTANSQSVLYMTDIGTGLGQWVFHLLYQNWPDQGTTASANENHVVISLYQQTGDIEIHFGNPVPWGVSATYGFACGIENATGTQGLACTDGWTGVSSQGRAFRFSPVTLTPLTITTPAALASAPAGADYSMQFAASGGMGPYHWADATQTTTGLPLPAGWQLSTDGLLNAPASAMVAGTYTFDLFVSDQTTVGFDTRQFTITVTAAAGGGGGPGTFGLTGSGGGSGGCVAGGGGLGVICLAALVLWRRRRS